MMVFSDSFVVKYDEESKSLQIVHPNVEFFDTPLISISVETLEGMSFAEASQFVGERLILLIPALRGLYEGEYKSF
jgi:hypothetical protein